MAATERRVEVASEGALQRRARPETGSARTVETTDASLPSLVAVSGKRRRCRVDFKQSIALTSTRLAAARKQTEMSKPKLRRGRGKRAKYA